MRREKRLTKLLKNAAKLDKDIKEILSDTKDYDLSRLLKKIDAELMDLRHNLELACRLTRKSGKDE